MIHTATLVHDDVLDEAELRRHVPTVNAGWGNKVSILLGDMLFTHAFHLTSTVDGRACEIIGEATNRVCAGRTAAGHRARQPGPDRGRLLRDHRRQDRGADRMLRPARRAVRRRVRTRSSTRLANFGRNLGLAFQIADDLLDLVGDEDTAGKTLGTDLEQQKLTLPVIHCLHRLPAAEARIAPRRDPHRRRRARACACCWRWRRRNRWPTPAARPRSSPAPPATNWSACRAASAARSSKRFATGPSAASGRSEASSYHARAVSGVWFMNGVSR